MKRRMQIGILLSGLWLLFAASPAFAATEADCPTVDLETKTIEGIWRGGEFPRFSMELPDGTLFFLGARQEEIEKAFGTATGQQVFVQYIVRQQWYPPRNECYYVPMFESGLVLPTADAEHPSPQEDGPAPAAADMQLPKSNQDAMASMLPVALLFFAVYFFIKRRRKKKHGAVKNVPEHMPTSELPEKIHIQQDNDSKYFTEENIFDAEYSITEEIAHIIANENAEDISIEMITEKVNMSQESACMYASVFLFDILNKIMIIHPILSEKREERIRNLAAICGVQLSDDVENQLKKHATIREIVSFKADPRAFVEKALLVE